MPFQPCRLLATMLLAIFGAPATFVAESVAAESEPRVAGRTRTEWHSATASPAPEVRRQAVAALSQFGPSAISQLESLAGDPDPAVRIWALRGLKRKRLNGVTPPTASGTLAAQHASTRHSWTERDSRRAVELSKARLDDPHVSVRIAAATTLASHDQVKPALDMLAAALASPIPGARIEAISELKSLGAAATPVLDAIRAADDAPNAGDYVTRIRNQILEDLAKNPR